MARGLVLVPVFYFVGVFVHVDPVEDWGAGGDGGDEAFAAPGPGVGGVRHEVAGEGVGGRAFEFELVVFGGVVVVGGGGCDVELQS